MRPCVGPALVCVARIGASKLYSTDGSVMTDRGDFEVFAADAMPRLRRAFVGVRGPQGAADATSEALAYAWEHWNSVKAMENGVGYLFRVGQSRTRPRRRLRLPPPSEARIPDVEPDLVPALLDLSPQQRGAVWLVHGCQWRHREVAEALDISASAVATHLDRGMTKLRERLEVDARA